MFSDPNESIVVYKATVELQVQHLNFYISSIIWTKEIETFPETIIQYIEFGQEIRDLGLISWN